MKLVYDATLEQVHVGHTGTLLDGSHYRIDDIRQPTSPASTGRVFITNTDLPEEDQTSQGYYPSVIEATWIEREDRPIETLHVYQDGKDFYIDPAQRNFFTDADKVLIQYKNGFAHFKTDNWVDDSSHAEQARTWFTTRYCILNGYEPVFEGE